MATNKCVYSSKEVLGMLQKEDNSSNVESKEDLELDSNTFFEEDLEDDINSNDAKNIFLRKKWLSMEKIPENAESRWDAHIEQFQKKTWY